jgi:hypothetical protein
VIFEGSTNLGSGQCSYSLNISTDASSTDLQSVKITLTGSGVDKSTCITNLSSSAPATTISFPPVPCSVNFGDLEISYEGYQNNGCTSDSDDPCSSGIVLNPLPVELTAFQANQERFHQVQLEWVTASEENNAMFSVEHSTDARNFVEIAKVEGQGNSNIEYYYSHTDKFPDSGINYYRLKQIDFDGTFSYSEIISIDVDKNTTKPFVIGNSLSKNEVTLIFNETPKENTRLEVFNASGIMFYQNKINPETAYLSIDISAFEPGMYFVRVPLGKEYRIERFVKIGE